MQIGHIEQFNAAFVSFLKKNPSPIFIESHRLSSFNERGLDVDVILDLMIHDIDLVLSLIKSDIKSGFYQIHKDLSILKKNVRWPWSIEFCTLFDVFYFMSQFSVQSLKLFRGQVWIP